MGLGWILALRGGFQSVMVSVQVGVDLGVLLARFLREQVVRVFVDEFDELVETFRPQHSCQDIQYVPNFRHVDCHGESPGFADFQR